MLQPCKRYQNFDQLPSSSNDLCLTHALIYARETFTFDSKTRKQFLTIRLQNIESALIRFNFMKNIIHELSDRTKVFPN